ncbi:hypothetical protein APHAL10511_007565 [Amanita phalloides]|nr:hypothetical protein APHAL10511_007565 [Amanita phalloides]
MPERRRIKALKNVVSILRRSKRDIPNERVGLACLPVEILLHIGNNLALDPETTLQEFKNLRLVCKPFDTIFAPIVLSSIHVFYPSHRGKVLARCHQLRALTAISNEFSCVKTLTLHSWDWVFQTYARLEPNSDYKTQVKAILWNYILVPAGYILWTLYIDPSVLPRQAHKFWARRRAKHYIKHIDRVSFHLPHVQCVRWRLSTPHIGNAKSVLLNLRILETLPSLTELDLIFHSSNDGLDEIATTMARLHNLRKITARIIPSDNEQEHRFRWLKQALAHNPHLTHLDLYHLDSEKEQLVALSDLFEDIPLTRPLQLQHLRISPFFYHITPTISPHIRSLTSINVCFPYFWNPHAMDDIWQTLYVEGIYVTEIQTNRITEDMLNYLRRLENLTSLSLYDLDSMHQERNQESAKLLFPVLAQHSNSLRHLRFEPYDWGYWFNDDGCEPLLLRCNKLEEFVLHYLDNSGKYWREIWRDITLISRIVSQINCAVCTVVVEGNPKFYKRFIHCCREDPRLSVRALCERIVFHPSKSSCSYFI